MIVQFKIAMNEIEHCPDLSYYNYVVWKFTNTQRTGFTHFVEIYNDVDNYPMYHFGKPETQKDGSVGFTVYMTGEGPGIDNKDIGWGGRFVTVDAFWYKDLTV
jgi:hypothetical protein